MITSMRFSTTETPILLQSVIDGDLCEQYSLLGVAKQKTIAEELDRQPSEVMIYFFATMALSC